MTGVDKLQEGTKVNAQISGAAKSAGPAAPVHLQPQRIRQQEGGNGPEGEIR